MKKKSSVSYQPEGLPEKRKKSSKKNAAVEVAELSDQQLKSFKKVSKSRHKQLKAAVAKHRGRPAKDPDLKENIVSIRFSNVFLERLKSEARQNGYTKWQTFAKDILAERIGLK